MATAVLTEFNDALAVASNLTSPVNANTWNATYANPNRFNGTQAVVWQNNVSGSFQVRLGVLNDDGVTLPPGAIINNITLSFDYSITISDWLGANPVSLRGGSPSQVTTGHTVIDNSGNGTYTGTYSQDQSDMLPITRESLFDPGGSATWWWQVNRVATVGSGVDTSFTISNYTVTVDYTPGSFDGPLILGVNTDVTAKRAFAMGLDNDTHVHAVEGTGIIYGDLEVTGDITVGGTSSGDSISDRFDALGE